MNWPTNLVSEVFRGLTHRAQADGDIDTEPLL